MISNKNIFIFFLFQLLSSCSKDFLDVNNTQQLYRESYVKDLTSLHEYLNGAYYRLSLYFESGDAVSTYAELVADNLRPFSTTSSPGTVPHYNWVQDDLGGLNMNNFWLNTYATIRSCSFVIDEVDNYREEDPEKADDIKGQALAVRALLYFKLINVFAQPYSFTTDASHPGVPYITTSDITKSYSRQSVAEVYDGMITDLSRALELLPSLVTENRFMNHQAAKALLARIYLFKEDFSNAKIMATEVANQVPLMTISSGYPNDIFKFKSPSNTETLFQLNPLSSSNFLGLYVRRATIAYTATNDLASMLIENPNDVRKNWIKDSIIGGTTFRLVKKYPAGVAPEANPTVTVQENAYYPAVLRSSEMFLTVAEAAVKIGDESTARTYLDAIRKRSNPSIPSITASGNALIDSIYKERRKELAFEGLRMHDLLRWKKGVSRTDALPGTPTQLPFPSDKAISPIPESEVRLSGIPQNNSY